MEVLEGTGQQLEQQLELTNRHVSAYCQCQVFNSHKSEVHALSQVPSQMGISVEA